MATDRRLAANRLNALRSTGPRTAAGKRIVAANALTSGLFSRLLVLPALGESIAASEEFRGAVADDLQPVGAVELELTDRVAHLLWRQRRVVAYESAVATAGMQSLPPHPETAPPTGTIDCQPPPATAPTATKLAFCRAALRSMQHSLEVTHAAVGVLDTGNEEDQDSEQVDWEAAGKVTTAASELLGWPAPALPGPWVGVVATIGLSCRSGAVPPWTRPALLRALDAVAEDAGRDAAQFRAEVHAKLLADAGDLAARITEREHEEQRLAAQLLDERARAAALGLYHDDGVVARVVRAESHLSRELERTMALLARVQADRRERDAAAGDAGPVLRVVGGAVAGARQIGFDLQNVLPAAGG